MNTYDFRGTTSWATRGAPCRPHGCAPCPACKPKHPNHSRRTFREKRAARREKALQRRAKMRGQREAHRRGLDVRDVRGSVGDRGWSAGIITDGVWWSTLRNHSAFMLTPNRCASW